MTRKPQAKTKPKEIELEPDAWGRFERFIDGIAKSSVSPRAPSKPPKRRREKKPTSK
jgi:hypothetical protein